MFLYSIIDMGKPPIPKAKQKEIAQERIKVLFKQAANVFPTNKRLANRYVTLARKIAMKVKVRIPLQHKRRFCKHCYKFLQPGVNSRTRTRDKKVIISCFECKKFTRISFK
jgi:ribonuclease P protein subunit RPR2